MHRSIPAETGVFKIQYFSRQVAAANVRQQTAVWHMRSKASFVNFYPRDICHRLGACTRRRLNRYYWPIAIHGKQTVFRVPGTGVDNYCWVDQTIPKRTGAWNLGLNRSCWRPRCAKTKTILFNEPVNSWPEGIHGRIIGGGSLQQRRSSNNNTRVSVIILWKKKKNILVLENLLFPPAVVCGRIRIDLRSILSDLTNYFHDQKSIHYFYCVTSLFLDTPNRSRRCTCRISDLYELAAKQFNKLHKYMHMNRKLPCT